MDRPRRLDHHPRRDRAASTPSSPTSRTTRPSSWLPESAESTKVVEELSSTVDPNDIPTLVVYHRDGGLTAEDLAAMDEQAAEIAEIDGVTDAGVLTPNVAAQQPGPPGPARLRGRRGRLPLPSPSTSARTAGPTSPTPPTRSATSPQIDGVTVHLAGYGGQAADAAEAFEGIDTNLILITLLRGDRDPAVHLPQPDPVAPADPQRGLRLHDRRRAWSTCWPSTPTSPSTARARRSSASW